MQLATELRRIRLWRTAYKQITRLSRNLKNVCNGTSLADEQLSCEFEKAETLNERLDNITAVSHRGYSTACNHNKNAHGHQVR